MKSYKSIDISNMSQAIYDFPDHIQTAVKIGDNISLDHTYNGIQNIVLSDKSDMNNLLLNFRFIDA